MPKITIRVAEERDLPAVIAGYEWLFAPPGSRPPTWDEPSALLRLRQTLADDRATVLVAITDDLARGQVVGFCAGYLDIVSVRFGQRCWVEDLATHPQWRSQGIGTLLLDAACDWAREHGASHIELDSGDARLQAHRFYQARTPSWTSRCFGWTL
jgi:GNAT superfamily N-acetyltransferase